VIVTEEAAGIGYGDGLVFAESVLTGDVIRGKATEEGDRKTPGKATPLAAMFAGFS